MVSSSSNRNNDVDATEKHVKKTPPDRKPLANVKFYLDVKNSNKLETAIRNLGGEIEVALSREVNHFITDKEECFNNKGAGSIPETPPSRANGSFNSPATNTPCRPKSRADAMLERARRCSNVIVKDPLEDARNWNINIISVRKATAWLEKLSTSTKLVAKKKHSNFFDLKAPFVKYESFTRSHRPIFRQIQNWPKLNLLGNPSEPGLILRSRVEHNMTRKTRSNQTRNDTAHRPGYCEVCRVEYLKLDEHLESEKHLTFVKDKANFLGLDNLINDGTNLETFLKTNYIAVDGNCIESEYCSPVSRKMPRRRNNMQHVKMKNSPCSPDAGTPRLRPRNSITSNYIQHFDDLEEELKLEDMIPIRELRSSARQSSIQVNMGDKAKEIAEMESDTWGSGRPKRSCLRGKRISADERLVVDNKSYYKVEVLGSKLRSSETPVKTNETTKKAQTPIPEEKDEVDDKGLIVKFKRMRTSELLQLNNEAENFLFPKKDESETDTDVDADCPNTTVSTTRGDSTVLLSSEDESPVKHAKNEVLDESSMDTNSSFSTNRRKPRLKSEDSNDSNVPLSRKSRRSSIDSSCSTDTQSGQKRKRRTHAEAFILDNQKYYKFETPGSRLRYHGSLLSQLSSKTPKNGDCLSHSSKDVKKEVKSVVESADFKNSKINLDEIIFSFESVPKSEPWYETFQRQDRGDVYYSSFSESGYFWRSLLLPYEMGPIPPLDPRICINTYQELKKKLMEPCSTSTSAGSNTPEPMLTDSVDSNMASLSEDNSLSIDGPPAENKEETTEEKLKIHRVRRRKGILVGKNPRKSPRQHASTLAILSSLLHQRKRRSRNSESPQKILPAIPEDDNSNSNDKELATNETEVESCKSNEDIPIEIEDLFKVPFDLSDEIDIPTDREIAFHSSPDAIAILEEYEKKKTEELTLATPYVRARPVNVRSAGRKPVKKRKNLTGWPNKNKTKLQRLKKEVKDDEESTQDTISNPPDSEDENFQLLEESEVNGVKPTVKNGKKKKADTDQNSFNNVNSDVQLNDRVTKLKTDEHLSDRVVDLEKWENAEKVLSAKLTNTDVINNDQFQPFVVVQKLENSEVGVSKGTRRARSSSSPHRTVKRSRRMPASPKSPRALRKPRGRWYRER